MVTDFSTIFYLLDSVIDVPYRNKGIANQAMKKFIDVVKSKPEYKGCHISLYASEQAKPFYSRLGFNLTNDKYMLFRVPR